MNRKAISLFASCWVFLGCNNSSSPPPAPAQAAVKVAPAEKSDEQMALAAWEQLKQVAAQRMTALNNQPKDKWNPAELSWRDEDVRRDDASLINPLTAKLTLVERHHTPFVEEYHYFLIFKWNGSKWNVVEMNEQVIRSNHKDNSKRVGKPPVRLVWDKAIQMITEIFNS